MAPLQIRTRTKGFTQNAYPEISRVIIPRRNSGSICVRELALGRDDLGGVDAKTV